jgi:hypothetical protein
VKAFTKCRADPAARPGHHRDGTVEFHSTMLRRSRVSEKVVEEVSSLTRQSPKGRPMTETIQRRAAHDLVVIAEAIEVIDKALAEIGQRQLVTTTEVADLLLDVRQLLSERADSTTASTK